MTVRRYPLAPLVELTGEPLHRFMVRMGLSGSTFQEYRDRGVTEPVADRLAVAAGFHPFVVWPEMVEDAIEDCQARCAECGAPFWATRRGHVYCGPVCSHKASNRAYSAKRYRSDPDHAERERAARRARYWANRELESARRRARYVANREREMARQAAYRARNRARGGRRVAG